MSHGLTSFRTITLAAIRRLAAAAAIVVSLTVTVRTQTVTSTTSSFTPAGLAPGAPAGSYALTGFDNINLYNGDLNFRLPLLTVGGRGNARFTITLPIEQRWSIEHLVDCLDPPSERCLARHTYFPVPNTWQGLTPGYSPGVMQGRRTSRPGANSCPPGFYGFTLTRLTFTGSDGTEFEFIDQIHNGDFVESICATTPPSRGTVFVTKDGSAATFISDSNINDFFNATPMVFPTGLMKLRDGTVYRISNGLVTWLQDRNGNRISFSYSDGRVTTITDSLNRIVSITYASSNQGYDQISFKGFNGITRNIRIKYVSVIPSEVLRIDFRAAGFLSFAQLFPLNGSSGTTYFPGSISSVELPDSRRYGFYYNPYGELARVELPTGGAYEYDWGGQIVSGPAFQPNPIDGEPELNVYRRAVEKRVYTNGGSGSGFQTRTTFERTVDSNGRELGDTVVSNYDGGGLLLGRTRHYFVGLPTDTFSFDPLIYPGGLEGRETRTDTLDGTSTVRREEHLWVARTILGRASVDPRDIEIKTTWLDVSPSLVAKQECDYDIYNNAIEVREFGFGNGSAGQLVRRTHTDYVRRNPEPGGPNYQQNFDIHIRNLPSRQSIFNESGVEVARTTYEYDSYAPALTARANITGHDTTAANPPSPIHDTSYITRGNLTQETHWLLPALTPISTRMQYDIAGNVVGLIDPNNNPPTTFDFSDRFGLPDDESRSNIQSPPELGTQSTFALATRVTNALGHTTYAQYDYYIGKSVNGEDANGVVAKGIYADALDRPTEVVVNIVAGAPPTTDVRRRTTFNYNDFARITTTQSDQATYNDGVLKSVLLYDGLGRTIETRSYEGAGYITSKQEYDALGRVKRAFNPFRTASDETYGYADTTYDSLGRARRIETFTGAGASTGAVVTTYSGNAAIARDQSGKQRRSVTDALGRLKSVDEMNEYPSTSVYATTSYDYDAQDNLRHVIQGSQHRYFMYDSLSRLIRARNPEQNVNSPALDLLDQSTNNSQWCTSYSYNANGDLQTKTDARNVRTDYSYDQLNRPTRRTYSVPPGLQATPSVNYCYDSQLGLPAGSPSFSTGASTGKIVAVLYGGSSSTTGNYTGYDSVGRALVSLQKTDTLVYQMSYGYDLAGQMISETYPGTGGAASGRVVRTEYDAAGRVAGIRNGTAGSYYAGADPGDGLNRIAYASHGAISKMKLGNGLWEHTTFNSRLQPTQIGLGTVGSGTGSTSVLGLDYSYGVMSGAVLDTSRNNGNIESQTINAPGLTLKQSYTYDQVNRLLTAEEIRSGAQPPRQWKQQFIYDRFGNRNFDLQNTTPEALEWNPTIDLSSNRIQAGQGYGYDLTGNLTSDPSTNVGGILYDAENRQIGYSRPNSSTQYLYDGEGHRVRKTDGIGTTVFVYDIQGHLIAEYTTQALQPNGTRYLTSDNLGSTRVVTGTNPNQVVTARHDYLPFGAEIATTLGGRSGVQGYNPSDAVTHRFTGLEHDSESGLDYAHARYCANATGRFTSVDPAAATRPQPQSWNAYTYCLNNPLKYLDPSGLLWGYWVDGGGTRQYKWFNNALDARLAGATILGPISHYIYKDVNGKYTRLNEEGPNPNGRTVDERNGWGAYDTKEQAFYRTHGDTGDNSSPQSQAFEFMLADTGGRAGTAILGKAFSLMGRGATEAVTGIAEDAVAQTVAEAGVQANRTAGNTFRNEVASMFEQMGYDVEKEVYKRTGFGGRFIDIEVSKAGQVLGGIECKIGPRYPASQFSKDMWLRLFGERGGNGTPYVVTVVRKCY